MWIWSMTMLRHLSDRDTNSLMLIRCEMPWISLLSFQSRSPTSRLAKICENLSKNHSKLSIHSCCSSSTHAEASKKALVSVRSTIKSRKTHRNTFRIATLKAPKSSSVFSIKTTFTCQTPRAAIWLFFIDSPAPNRAIMCSTRL